jgi:photosystem II stability/assembly factor-like uncharacterized protein
MKQAFLIALCCGILGACDQGTSVPQQGPEAGTPTGWTVIPAGTANLNGVSGVSNSAVWVVGDKGTIGHWDGTKLLFEESGTKANLRSVWALNTEEAYAVGDGGTILKRGAGGWQLVAKALTRQVLTGVWADTTRVVAVGSNGTIILGTATGYQLVSNSSYQENLFGVTGTPGGAVTAVGALGLIVELNGTTVSRTPITNFTKLLVGVATGSSNTYVVGQEGTVYRADATGLNPVNGCPATALRSVATVGADAWIVGWDGTICKIAGSDATSFQYTDNRWFNGVYAASASSLWVVGASGTLLHGLPLPPPKAAQ